MSKPANPLAKYRSYSYYHVLAICDTSKTATELAASTDALDVWQHPTGEGAGDMMGRYMPKSIGGGQYCILINGATDAVFSITKANWSSYTASSATMDDRGTSIALEGTIFISEPRSVMFLDQVVRCCLELGIDSSNAYWVLKTFFVGYTFDVDSDTDGVDYITDVPPVIFLAYDVSGTFGVAGGEYEINFVAGGNSGTRLPHFSKSVRAFNFKAKDTFAATLTALQDEVNKNYKKYFECVKKQVESIDPKVAKALREVKYEIYCADPYNDSKYKVNDQATQVKDSPVCDDPGNLHVTAGVSIEDALHRIIGLCSKIKEEADVGIGGKKYIAKVHSWVTTEGPMDNMKFTVGYRIERQYQPTSISFDSASGGEATASFGKSLIEYDYIYTGKNIDILEFDMKMNMGIVYLQGMTIANQYKQPNQPVAVAGTGIAAIDIKQRQHNINNIPVYFGTNAKDALVRDSDDTKQQTQHAYSMSKHSTLEVVEVSVKLTGNPYLLGSINQTSDPEFVKDQKVQLDPNDGFARLSEWTTSPSFAKINVKMPRNQDDLSLFTGSQTSADSANTSNDYAVDFWFTGYYFIYGFDHVFDNGEFYQNMQALGVPEEDKYRKKQDAVKNRVATLEKRIKECYDNDIGCDGSYSAGGSGGGESGGGSGGAGASSSSSSSANNNVVSQPHSSLNEGNAKLEAQKNLPPNDRLANIKGYNTKASNEVKLAIHQAAINNPTISEEDLATMIAYESRFKSDAVNPWGYKGLGQFGDEAWKRFGHGDPLDPVANADATAKYMAYNKQKLIKNGVTSDPTVTDLYTMHQQGDGRGYTVVKKHYNGTGNDPIKLSAKNIKNNNLPKNPTHDDIYYSMEKNMNNQLINGPTPAPSKQVQQAPSAPIIKPSTEPAKTVTQAPQAPQPPAGKVSESTPPEKPKAKEILAAYRNCADEEKASSDPAKSKTCPKTADDKAGGSGSSSSGSGSSSSGGTQTGQASPGPRQQQTVVSSEIPGSVLNPVPAKPSVGTGPRVENDMSDVLNLTNTFFK